MWTKNNIPDLSGKIAIVTGSNTGIGFETAKALYAAGAQVTIAARDVQKAKNAIQKIQSDTPGTGTLDYGKLDLANIGQVREFADLFMQKHTKLDILVNNAGVMVPPAAKTDDGFELQFGVNFMGHFALTGYLLPILKQTANARVVTLSSGAATLVDSIDFDNLRLEKSYDEWREYAISKLADILFSYELDRRFKNARMSAIAVAAHPGVTRTDLQRNIPDENLEGMFAGFDQVMDPWQGALPSLFAATDASVEGGKFYGPDGPKEYAGYPALSNHHTTAMTDEVLAKRLWDYAENAIQLTYKFK
ncbi:MULTISPECIES: oxidoreductase [Sphingobacterium]|jgi:NAD(P)-dependent dehydrogenase (short-subunit alcohol dehydrogenase family)|uniref:oxidoreductase n=1 Tax=Sphingobacterium TaxID=28453 RepID=UPI002580D181|nr:MULTISPECIES: oxidoreductase [Sphingobacterium]